MSLFFGTRTIFDMIDVDRNGYTSYFIITLSYQKLCLMMPFASIFFAANDTLRWVPTVSEPLLFALLGMATIAGMSAAGAWWAGYRAEG